MASSKSSAVQECLPLSCTTCGAEVRLITFPTEPASVKPILLHLGPPAEPPTVAPTPNRTLRCVDISNSGGLKLANVRLARRHMTTSGGQADRPFTPFLVSRHLIVERPLRQQKQWDGLLLTHSSASRCQTGWYRTSSQE